MKQTQIIREVSIRDAEWDLWKTDTVFIIPAYGEKDAPIKVIWEILAENYGVILIDDWKNEDLVEKLIFDLINEYEYILIEWPKWIEKLNLSWTKILTIKKIWDDEREIELL